MFYVDKTLNKWDKCYCSEQSTSFQVLALAVRVYALNTDRASQLMH